MQWGSGRAGERYDLREGKIRRRRGLRMQVGGQVVGVGPAHLPGHAGGGDHVAVGLDGGEGGAG